MGYVKEYLKELEFIIMHNIQNLQELKIICVNDNSNNSARFILNSPKKEDPRINIITNKVNMCILYNHIYRKNQA